MKSIMIVDDDVYIGDMLEKVLTKEGYRIYNIISGVNRAEVMVRCQTQNHTKAVVKAASI